MTVATWARRLLVVLVGSALASCSWTWSAQGGYKQPCKRSYAPPVIDTVIATVASSVCAAGIIASIVSSSDDDGLHYSVVCYPAMAVAIPAILSAQRGYSGAKTCE
ncbi:MAG TPA: hypothetical protein VGM90_29555 [Kofleriaceae bacterium]|jgi:hypothetical protein